MSISLIWVTLHVANRNQGVLHSAIEYPLSYGSRSSQFKNIHKMLLLLLTILVHQCHIASTTAPVGPVDVSF